VKGKLSLNETLKTLADTVEQRGGYAKGSKVDKAVARAKKIASGPDLVESLERLVKLWEEAIGYEEDYMDMADFARDAIKGANS
jgi:hypothetical protein